MLFLRPCRRGLLLLSLTLTGIQACVEPYEPSLALSAEVLVVDGTLTNRPEVQSIRLARSQVFNGTSGTSAESGATVEILADDAQPVALREKPTTPGLYLAPEGFQGKSGVRYRLRFTLANGQRYESDEETMPAGPPIGRVYDRFDAAALPNAQRTQFTPANLIYVDFDDPAATRDFYRWEWTLWESQTWCASCTQGIYNLAGNGLSGACAARPALPRNNVYDYECLGRCWEILRNTESNLFADTYSNGRSVQGRKVAAIPFFQTQPALVEIRQYALGSEAFRYFKLLENQSQNTGGLADTPPAPLVGNVRNLANERENVAGYFSASAVSVARYWLDRQNTSGSPLNFFQVLNGRPVSPEPPTPLRPPQSVCIPSDTRTPVRPEGWRN